MGYALPFVFAFAFIISLVFRELLLEMGFSKEQATHPATVLVLPAISFTATMIFTAFFSGRLEIPDLKLFYESYSGIFMWMTVAFFLGGFLRLLVEVAQKNAQQPPKPVNQQPAQS
ncbi:hypothetical protein HYS54_05455 [Candidatus Micrarchaeota archaeon]|nr:hypothetical protein [Candidatus Micrarchaeota archaeon]